MRSAAFLCLVLALGGCAGGLRSKEEAAQLVPSDVAYNMTPDQWPDWFRDLGAKRVAQIAAKQRPAAIEAARDPRCDGVEVMSMDRADPANIDYVIYCKNALRITVSEMELH